MLRGERLPGSRWTEHDSTTAIALTLYEASLCPGCGHPLDQTTAETADPNSPERTHHYEAPLPIRCHACTAVEMRTPDYEQAAQPGALRFHAVRIDDTRPDDLEAGDTAP